MNGVVETIATRLQEAEASRRPIDPIAVDIGAGQVDVAYAV